MLNTHRHGQELLRCAVEPQLDNVSHRAQSRRCILRFKLSSSPNSRSSFGRRPDNCFGKPDGPAPSAKITERARATAEASAVARKVASGSPTGQLPAPKLRKRARATRSSEAVAEAPAVAQKVFSGSPTGPTPASKRRERAFGQISKKCSTWPLITCLCGTNGRFCLIKRPLRPLALSLLKPSWPRA